MLGTLAKWLRIIGYDTLFNAQWDENDLVKIMESEDRLVLTRNYSLAEKLPAELCLFVTSQKLKVQFAQVVRQFNLDTVHNLFSICTVCNSKVVQIAKEKVAHLVPPYIFENHELFLQCPDCGRVYWQGSHYNNVRQWIKEALGPKY